MVESSPLMVAGLAGLLLLALLLYLVPIRLWIAARAAGAKVSALSLMAMKLRRVPPERVVLPYLAARKAGVEVELHLLEAHFLAGGDVARLVDALVAAREGGLEASFALLAAIDLAGRDVLAAVRAAVEPRTLETPALEAVAKGGARVVAIARAAVRANLDRFVDGADEETLLARIAGAATEAIGDVTRDALLERREAIASALVDRELDDGTAFELLSVELDLREVEGQAYR
jgi:uncharacterized protein YqfA (UPF0365 family)